MNKNDSQFGENGPQDKQISGLDELTSIIDINGPTLLQWTKFVIPLLYYVSFWFFYAQIVGARM